MNTAITDSLRDALAHATDGLLGGQASATDWHNAVASELFAHHLAAYADAAGVEVNDPKALAAVKKIVGGQVDYLGKFTDDIEAGRYADKDEGLRSRADMYAGALRGTWYSGKYPGLSTYPGAGDTRCLTNCKCDLEERDDGIHWIIDEAAENCPDCIDMAAGSPYEAA